MHSVELTHSSGATASIFPYGAHLHSWKTAAGKEWIFMSSQAALSEGKSIRGGVPIIFPQFNEFGPGKRHGFARTTEWQQLPETHEVTDAVEICFQLTHSPPTLQDWPHHFSATYTVRLNETSLELILEIKNTGDNVCLFTAALHSYFAISQLDEIVIEGLKNVSYWDNDGSAFDKRFSDRRDLLAVDDAVDRVYFDIAEPVCVTDGKDQLKISQQGFRDAVIWNPGQSGAKILADLADDEYQHMICIESATIDKPVCLAPGEEWVGKQILHAGRS